VDETGFIQLRGGYGSVYRRGNSRISLLEAATNSLLVFNMSAAMARHGGRVQLEQSDMFLALNMAKMAKGGFSRAATMETKYVIKTPRAEVRKEKKWEFEFLAHIKVQAAIERNPAMLHPNHTSGYLLCQNGTAQIPQTHWRREGPVAPPPARHRLPTPLLSGTPPAQSGNSSGAQHTEIINLPAGYAYSHPSHPCAELFNLDASAQDSQHNKDFDPDMLTDEGTSTG